MTGLLVAGGTVEEQASRLEYAMDNPEMWQDMKRNGRELVEREYDSRLLNKQLMEMYAGLVSRAK